MVNADQVRLGLHSGTALVLYADIQRLDCRISEAWWSCQDFAGTDSFTLTVAGKILRDEGKSTIHVMVSRTGAL